ncbi:MAG: hypothetical protein YHS30scaffold392_27 [Phage 64_12]|nr:MAG: hypothetical protein YHS30scaffold392_27 [Phage 64_12]
MKAFLAQLVHDIGPTFLGGFLGALVALAHLPGLTLVQQLAATLSGGLTAGFVCWALQDGFHLSSAAAGGLSFVMGLVAFRATPSLMKGVNTALENLPVYVTDLVEAAAERIRTIGGGTK